MNAHRHKIADRPIVVKVGSESTDFESPAGRSKLERLAFDVSYLIRGVGKRVVLITSGAVSHGRKILDVPRDRKLSLEEKRAFASVGQPRLIMNWQEVFNGVESSLRIRAVGQGLVTHAQIADDVAHRNGLMSGFEGLWANGILPILNENDFACPEEIEAMEKGADNDRNALLIARLVNAETLAVMTKSNGVYARAEDESTRIPVLHASRLSDADIVRMCGKPTKEGTGGMASKLAVVRDAANEGMSAHVFNGTDSTLLEHVEDSPKRTGGTAVVR